MLGAIFDGGDDKSYTTIQNKDHNIGKEEILRMALMQGGDVQAATTSNSASSIY